MRFAVCSYITTFVIAVYGEGDTPPPFNEANVTIPESKWAEGVAPEVDWYWDGNLEPAGFSPPNPPVEEGADKGLN